MSLTSIYCNRRAYAHVDIGNSYPVTLARKDEQQESRQQQFEKKKLGWWYGGEWISGVCTGCSNGVYKMRGGSAQKTPAIKKLTLMEIQERLALYLW